MPEVLRRGNRYTLAATMTANGRGLTAVCQGSLNREKFLDFMRQLLPGMNPHWDVNGNRTFLPESILVLDNCSSHRCEEFYQLARQYRVKLAFTPPYMPW